MVIIGQLAADVAHELKGIVTHSHLLLEEVEAENPSQIRLVFMNMVINAAEAMSGGCTFVDLKIPWISGFEVLEGVRTTDSPILTITGYATVSS